MKKNINDWVLTIGICILISLSTYGQRDTIKYYPYILNVLIIDSNAYPIGTKDSFIITTRPDTTCNHGKFNMYTLTCNCNEYLLFDTLIKFNKFNNYDLFCRAFRVIRILNSTQIQKLSDNLKIFPNPVHTNLIINNQLKIAYVIKLFDLYGGLIFYNGNIDYNFLIDLSNQKQGIYYLQINNGLSNLIVKIIKI